MSNNYNLTDNVNETFDFSVNDIVYIMRYPTVDEIENLQEKTKEITEKMEKGGVTKEDEIQVQQLMYDFISPQDPTSPGIATTMKKQNIKVLQNFNIMIKTEFGITG